MYMPLLKTFIMFLECIVAFEHPSMLRESAVSHILHPRYKARSSLSQPPLQMGHWRHPGLKPEAPPRIFMWK